MGQFMTEFLRPLRRCTAAAVAAAAGLAVTPLLCGDPALTLIQDSLYKADGKPFEGTAVIQWRSFEASDLSPIQTQLVATRIVNGVLRVQLVPTTTAAGGAYYYVRYNSDGRTQFVEYWNVPPSELALKLHDIRISGPGSVSTPPPAATALAIDDVTNLRQELDNRPLKGAGYANGRAAVIDDTGSLEAVLGDPLDCVRVDGTAAPCGSGGLPGFIDGETPAGTTDSVNRTFTLSNLPSPINSLMLFRNGMLQHTTRDYTISGSTITFATGSTPQSGDAMQAWYRVSAAGAPSSFADGETPAGAVDGVNATFLLAAAPAPVSSLQLYRNGLLQKPGTDYTLSGNTVVFLPAAVPQAGDLLLSYYRY